MVPDSQLSSSESSENLNGDCCAINNSIRSKMVLSLAIVFLIFLGINEVVQRASFSSEMEAIERRSFLLFSVSALMVLWLLLHRIVVQPLADLKHQIAAFQGNNHGEQARPIAGNDEIADLAKTFHDMRERLKEAQRKLADASEANGRSEVAATVIHNVGNVLTNVNSLIDTANKRVEKLRVAPLHQLAKQLEQGTDKHDLLAATPSYLQGLATQLESDQRDLSELLETLDDNVRHIDSVIRDQHKHASQRVSLHRVDINELIDEAISCCQANLTEDRIRVRRVTDHQHTFVTRTDRSLVLQTMINVITNARQAIKTSSDNPQQIVVKLHAEGNSVVVNFQDSGCGMAAETLGHVFDAHFTTRESGSGLGLHFCALALKRCGGTIAASSNGLGQGSTITIRLPMEQSLNKARRTVLCETSTDAGGE
ncbi:Sensor protein ZraS [Rubripirellula amarantea]|uniref:histidine kinase n=1 Tax=Rubripirellula amarantea TaxID=2527999 RepID=A0A5C5WTA5_9BACT|nr:HAMP domain-containing sensor histidine kinase [Rubripirellula amarantea]TWT54164.1 Sensor protein ZraS [Rubripirellula amarantea]